MASTEPDKRLRVELADGPGYHPTSLAPMTSLATASRSRNVPDAELLTQPQPPVTSPDAGASGPRFSQPLPFCDQTCGVSRKAQQQISFSGLPARRSVMCGLTPRQLLSVSLNDDYEQLLRHRERRTMVSPGPLVCIVIVPRNAACAAGAGYDWPPWCRW